MNPVRTSIDSAFVRHKGGGADGGTEKSLSFTLMYWVFSCEAGKKVAGGI